jgi:hypothetical protein
MAVAATTNAIGAGASLAITRPGAADANGCLIVVAVVNIYDIFALPTMTGFTRWFFYGINRMASDGHYLYNTVLAKIGTAAETSTYVCSFSGGTAAKSVISAAAYRITDPLDTSVLANNLSTKAYSPWFVSTEVWYPQIWLVGNGSIVIDTAGMLCKTSAAAASLKLRGGDSTAVIHAQQETDAGGYFLSAAHGYRSSQTGVLPWEKTTAIGNLGTMVTTGEIRQSASSGGGPPLPPFATVGKTMYIGV